MSLYWSVVSSLSNVWKDKHLSIPLKVLPGSRHVCPAVYATETWIMLAFGITTWRHSIFPTTSINENPVNSMKSFVYFGSLQSSDGYLLSFRHHRCVCICVKKKQSIGISSLLDMQMC